MRGKVAKRLRRLAEGFSDQEVKGLPLLKYENITHTYRDNDGELHERVTVVLDACVRRTYLRLKALHNREGG